jgi:Putative MetA-pathway of phenol degradation
MRRPLSSQQFQRFRGRALFLSCVALWCVALPGSMGTAVAQDLEPRAYAASPIGLNFLVIAAGRSTGGVVVDASLPVEDVQASVNSLGVGAGRTIKIFGRTALLVASLPYAWANVSGRVGEETGQVSRSGLADPRIKLSVNLVGGRALSVREFVRAPRPTVLGVSLSVVPPLGQYYRDKLINLGANRWAFKPEIGVSHLVGKWTIEGYAGAWLFTANDEFYTGTSVREQRPVVCGSRAMRRGTPVGGRFSTACGKPTCSGTPASASHCHCHCGGSSRSRSSAARAPPPDWAPTSRRSAPPGSCPGSIEARTRPRSVSKHAIEFDIDDDA